MNWKIRHKFKEGMKREEVIWFEKDFIAIRDGIGHTGSPEVESHFDIVKKAIEEPDEVKKDKDYPGRLCYYAWFSGDVHYPNNHMKVVIERQWYGRVKVITAYFTDSIKKGEQSIWTRN